MSEEAKRGDNNATQDKKILEIFQKSWGNTEKAQIMETKDMFITLFVYAFEKLGLIDSKETNLPAINAQKLKDVICEKTKRVAYENIRGIENLKKFLEDKEANDLKWMEKHASDFVKKLNAIIDGLNVKEPDGSKLVDKFLTKLKDLYDDYTKPKWYNKLSPYWTNFNKYFNHGEKSLNQKLCEIGTTLKNGKIAEGTKQIKQLLSGN